MALEESNNRVGSKAAREIESVKAAGESALGSRQMCKWLNELSFGVDGGPELFENYSKEDGKIAPDKDDPKWEG